MRTGAGGRSPLPGREEVLGSEERRALAGCSAVVVVAGEGVVGEPAAVVVDLMASADWARANGWPIAAIAPTIAARMNQMRSFRV